jgi:NADH:quinone reductase (non-electrogenic)
MANGDMDGGIWSSGQSQGLIHDIPTCEELVKNIMQQAENIVHARLDRMAS